MQSNQSVIRSLESPWIGGISNHVVKKNVLRSLKKKVKNVHMAITEPMDNSRSVGSMVHPETRWNATQFHIWLTPTLKGYPTDNNGDGKWMVFQDNGLNAMNKERLIVALHQDTEPDGVFRATSHFGTGLTHTLAWMGPLSRLFSVHVDPDTKEITRTMALFGEDVCYNKFDVPHLEIKEGFFAWLESNKNDYPNGVTFKAYFDYVMDIEADRCFENAAERQAEKDVWAVNGRGLAKLFGDSAYRGFIKKSEITSPVFDTFQDLLDIFDTFIKDSQKTGGTGSGFRMEMKLYKDHHEKFWFNDEGVLMVRDRQLPEGLGEKDFELHSFLGKYYAHMGPVLERQLRDEIIIPSHTDIDGTFYPEQRLSYDEFYQNYNFKIFVHGETDEASLQVADDDFQVVEPWDEEEEYMEPVLTLKDDDGNINMKVITTLDAKVATSKEGLKSYRMTGHHQRGGRKGYNQGPPEDPLCSLNVYIDSRRLGLPLYQSLDALKNAHAQIDRSFNSHGKIYTRGKEDDIDPRLYADDMFDKLRRLCGGNLPFTLTEFKTWVLGEHAETLDKLLRLAGARRIHILLYDRAFKDTLHPEKDGFSSSNEVICSVYYHHAARVWNSIQQDLQQEHFESLETDTSTPGSNLDGDSVTHDGAADPPNTYELTIRRFPKRSRSKKVDPFYVDGGELDAVDDEEGDGSPGLEVSGKIQQKQKKLRIGLTPRKTLIKPRSQSGGSGSRSSAGTRQQVAQEERFPDFVKHGRQTFQALKGKLIGTSMAIDVDLNTELADLEKFFTTLEGVASRHSRITVPIAG